MNALVLDSEAITRLTRRDDTAKQTLAALKTAEQAGMPVRVPAAVLAEQYRTVNHAQRVDALLSRHRDAIKVVDTDRALARRVGALLGKHSMGSEHHVDACVVAVAAACGGGVILTSDHSDIARLAEGLPGIQVVPLR